MKLCPKIMLVLISIYLFSAGTVAAQASDDVKPVFKLANYLQDRPATNDGDRFVIRNRLDSGATWTASADALIMYRTGGKNFPLVQGVVAGAMDTFNSTDFVFQMGVGPRVSIVGEDVLFGCDIEASYFGIDSWSATKTLVAPAGGMQLTLPDGMSQSFAEGQGLTMHYVSRLHSAELNFRRPILENLYVLAGFRYLQLHENLSALYLDAPEIDANVDNHLYGGQIGLNVAFVNRERFSIEGVVKGGVFGNNADLTMPIGGSLYGGSITHTAFMGEVGLMGIVRVTHCLSLRGGYQAMWLDGVGIASDQYQSVSLSDPKPYMGGTLFYHGAFAGLELAF